MTDAQSAILGGLHSRGFGRACSESLLVLSTGFIARLLRRLAPSRAEMRHPKALQPREQQITISAWRKVNANVPDLLEPDGDRLAIRHHLHPHPAAERLTEPVD
jgi:hypothetical protein